MQRAVEGVDVLGSSSVHKVEVNIIHFDAQTMRNAQCTVHKVKVNIIHFAAQTAQTGTWL